MQPPGCFVQELNNYENIYVLIKNNIQDKKYNFKSYNNIILIDDNYNNGFGKNNNLVYDYCKNNLKMSSDDYFIVLNPDVFISLEKIQLLCNYMNDSNEKIATINLFRDHKLSIPDDSIRHFPKFIDFIAGFIKFNNNSVIDKSKINQKCEVDWSAGSFIAFSSAHYGALKGFDERYFMYCEDIDICYRSACIGERVIYYPNIKAVHLAKHANRKIFSKHFFWHIRSVLRYCTVKLKV